ncbi:PQQ-dependent sugar dehydrogenase [Marinobacterium sedimentorum]|uniref:PQQ-dependent sugar dehydrogenase n=1 Tax=Marinobacterium sedimentorum TaxID=2927804 RepID=UPI0020C619C8|nr:sorbosone dehydrogenase family protein [Marinobacterium sedimentorum]MCP8688260.1 sorbosone dehydrogenase family protein [Marinobacterium sedimentorum]
MKYFSRQNYGLAVVAIFIIEILSTGGCAQTSTQPESFGVGATPTLPAPKHALVPTVKIAPAIGWPADKKPVSVNGLQVNAFAKDLDHPRWLYVLPNGDVLVAETNAPYKPDDNKGIKGWVMGLIMKRAGAAEPSANRITLLRDSDGDGVADMQSVFLEHLNSPFGMALVGDNLYIANSDAVLRFPYRAGDTRITASGNKLIDLPAGTINHHWTKNIIANPDGSKLYVTVGSNSNIAENGMDVETDRAAIWVVDIDKDTHHIFARGLRNPNGMAWEPVTGKLWTVVNERDELGNDLVPDYLTSVTEGGFYGWPYSYYGQHIDTRVEPQRPELVATAIAPDYALGSHVAPLGLTSSVGNTLSPIFANGMFIGEHGSWNRKPPSGYKVVFIPFFNGKPSANPIDVVSGFLNEKGEAYGRPVGVTIDKTGALLVADDVGNTVWRVSKAVATPR